MAWLLIHLGCSFVSVELHVNAPAATNMGENRFTGEFHVQHYSGAVSTMTFKARDKALEISKFGLIPVSMWQKSCVMVYSKDTT